MRSLFPGAALLVIATVPGAQTPPAYWPLDAPAGDAIRGFHEFVSGVRGNALRFDGQTTHVIRCASQAPRMGEALTVEAWVALQTYPWTWCAVVDQEKGRESGYFLGIDPEGRFGLHLAAGGKWRESRSDIKLPLYKWNHIAATYRAGEGIALYWNGKPAGTVAVSGAPSYAPAQDLWIGRNHTALGLSEEVRVVADVAFSFDGLIDELRLHSRALDAAEIAKAYAEVQPSATAPLSPPALPGAPKGPGRFGGYYTRLRYTDEWENPWRVGDAADVVVRFDGAPYQFILWRGTSYVPVWATENGIWYNNQFFETGTGEIETSAEPMADKQARYSFVRILESSAARVVVRWRYAPVNLNYDMVHTGELTGWGDWVEETFTIYPDATSVRKVQVWSSTPVVVEGKGPGKGGFRQWQESIVINAAGARPEDNIEPEAVTLANLKGESHTYSWEKDAPGEYVRLDEERRKALSGELRVFPEYQDRHKWLMQPDHANIQVVNLKAKYRPYVIVDPRSAIGSYAGEIIRERSMFPWWNHWPVSQQVRSNGRWAVAPDRVSHSSLTSIYRRASSAPP